MRTFNIHRQKIISTTTNQPMKTIEELHAEAQSNLAALRASQLNAYCFMICVVLIASALIICSLI